MEREFLDIWDTKYKPARPRRLLAFDGGGVRGIVALQIAQQLAKMTGEGKDFRLGNYFDYIGGTSTGAIIATGLAMEFTSMMEGRAFLDQSVIAES
jgi:patatin-like phospholipase/acyl hydrolase